MNPIRNPASGCDGVSAEGLMGDVGGDGGRRQAPRRRCARFLTFTRSGRSLEDSVYSEGTCRLKAMIICALLETGLTFSRYAVKLSSLHRMSGCGGVSKEGGDCKPVAAKATMLHIGQPALGAKAMDRWQQCVKGLY